MAERCDQVINKINVCRFVVYSSEDLLEALIVTEVIQHFNVESRLALGTLGREDKVVFILQHFKVGLILLFVEEVNMGGVVNRGNLLSITGLLTTLLGVRVGLLDPYRERTDVLVSNGTVPEVGTHVVGLTPLGVVLPETNLDHRHEGFFSLLGFDDSALVPSLASVLSVNYVTFLQLTTPLIRLSLGAKWGYLITVDSHAYIRNSDIIHKLYSDSR